MEAPSLVSAWDALVQQLCPGFTAPTGRTWSQIALGWILNRGPATVTAIFRTLGNAADRHWTVYQKLFYRAAGCLSTLCTALLQRVVYPLLLEAAQGQAGPVVADGQYARRDVVRALPENVNLVSRIRRDAAIYALPKTRRRGQRGRPAKKGPRLPTPRQLAARRQAGWQKMTFFKQGRRVERLVLGRTCLGYHVCRDQPIRLVLVRDPAGWETDDSFFCTGGTVPDAEIVPRYDDHWGVEEAIQEAKQCLGFETTQGWCSRTVNRPAPLAMVLVTLVKAWYARGALQEPALLPEPLPWYRHKVQPSRADTLAALRKVLWQHRITLNSRSWPRVRRLFQMVSFALSGAA